MIKKMTTQGCTLYSLNIVGFVSTCLVILACLMASVALINLFNVLSDPWVSGEITGLN